MIEYDLYTESAACVNELYYRNGPQPQALSRHDAPYVRETIERYLREAYEAGRIRIQ